MCVLVSNVHIHSHLTWRFRHHCILFRRSMCICWFQSPVINISMNYQCLMYSFINKHYQHKCHQLQIQGFVDLMHYGFIILALHYYSWWWWWWAWWYKPYQIDLHSHSCYDAKKSMIFLTHPPFLAKLSGTSYRFLFIHLSDNRFNKSYGNCSIFVFLSHHWTGIQNQCFYSSVK